jgi:hypothetical protein
MKLLKEEDVFDGLTVTKTSDKFCFFGKKRMSWNTIQKHIKSGKSLQYRRSPNRVVDWTDKDDVIKYFNSFILWNTYISVYCRNFQIFEGVLEIKDNLVFFENEYYLSCPIISWVNGSNYWNAKNENIIDGKYFITLLKQENDWYPNKESNRGNIILNLFILGNKTKTLNELSPNSNELWANMYSGGITFYYERSVWNGLNIYLTGINLVELFRKYYVKERWGSGIYIDIEDSEILNILTPIHDTLREIISDALRFRKFDLNIDESYGEISISNNLRFDSSVAEKVFNLINKQINNE